MVDERLQRGASGHLLKTATGHLANTCGIDCDYCTGTLPANITATISGITACACDPTNDHRVLLTLQGSVVMTAIPGYPTTCVWVFTDTDAATYEGYPSKDCPAGAHNDTDYNIVYKLVKYDSTTWYMLIRVHIRLSPSEVYYHVFYDEQTVAADNCDLGVVFTNDWVVGDCWTVGGNPPKTLNMNRVAYGGTVTI